MRTSLGQMDGNDWERYCQKLLKTRYPADYQEVPSQFGGDLGIEGFTCSGLLFQCYCPDEDPSGKDLYERQRDKITQDITKLIRNAAKISELGAGTIQEWHFLTPNYNSRHLIQLCRKKETEVRDKCLASIHSDFRILLKTDDDYLKERQIILGTANGLRVEPSSEEPPQKELEKLLTSNNTIVLNIKTKLGKLDIVSAKRTGLLKELVNGYIIGRNELELLYEKYPIMYKSVQDIKLAKESQLVIRTLSCSDNHGTILHEILKEYENKLSGDLSSGLSSAMISKLSTEAISDWLGRCPLDFPDLEGTHA